MGATTRGMLAIALAWSALAAGEEKTITAAEAAEHVGQDVTVCGHVVKTDKAFSRTGRSYLLRIDQAAPPIFTVVVVGSQVDNPFIDADRRYAQKNVCVKGRVRNQKGMVHMQLNAPNQIRIVKSSDR